MIVVRTHENRWVVRDSVRSCAHAMITRTALLPAPVYRVVLCEPFEAARPLTIEAPSLDEAVAAVESELLTLRAR